MRNTCHPEQSRREEAAGKLPENGLLEGVPSVEPDDIPGCWNWIVFKVSPSPSHSTILQKETIAVKWANAVLLCLAASCPSCTLLPARTHS